MSFVTPNVPNITDFTTYVYAQGVPSADLPSGSQYLDWALGYAIGITLVPPACMPAIEYTIACYNAGMHQLLKIAQDETGQTFFTTARTTFGLNAFVFGVSTSASDNGTSNTLATPDFIKSSTLQTIDFMRTPWGRDFVEYQQSYGPNVVGVS